MAISVSVCPAPVRRKQQQHDLDERGHRDENPQPEVFHALDISKQSPQGQRDDARAIATAAHTRRRPSASLSNFAPRTRR